MKKPIAVQFGNQMPIKFMVPVSRIEVIVSRAVLISQIRYVVGASNVPNTMRRMDGFNLKDETGREIRIDHVRVGEQGVQFLVASGAEIEESVPLPVKELAEEFGLEFTPVRESPPPRVVISLKSGVITGVRSTVPLEFVVIDYDTDGADEKALTLMPAEDSKGGMVQVLNSGIEKAEVDEARVEAAYVAAKIDPSLICPICLTKTLSKGGDPESKKVCSSCIKADV